MSFTSCETSQVRPDPYSDYGQKSAASILGNAVDFVMKRERRGPLGSARGRLFDSTSLRTSRTDLFRSG
jgi:hypothetical protein